VVNAKQGVQKSKALSKTIWARGGAPSAPTAGSRFAASNSPAFNVSKGSKICGAFKEKPSQADGENQIAIECMLKHNGKKGSCARKPIREQQAAKETDSDGLPMKWRAVISKEDGMHGSKKGCVHEDGQRTRPVHGRRITMEEKYALEKLLGCDGDETITSSQSGVAKRGKARKDSG
jgi:hypothetical protein